MPLSEAENERLGVLLENLSTVRGKLNSNAQSFLDDQIARHDKYSEKMFLSPKQKDWLENLHRQYCPGVALPPGDQLSDSDEGEDDDDDIDDQIPF